MTVDELLVGLGVLKVEEADILSKLKVARARELENQLCDELRDQFGIFKPCDRVWITNQVQTSAKSVDNDQKTAVTSVNGTKVHLATDSTFKTWRLAKNLKFS